MGDELERLTGEMDRLREDVDSLRRCEHDDAKERAQAFGICVAVTSVGLVPLLMLGAQVYCISIGQTYPLNADQILAASLGGLGLIFVFAFKGKRN